MAVKITGLKEIESKLNRIKDPAGFFDETVFRASVEIYNNLIEATPVDDLSGLTHTKNLWADPVKLVDSVYTIDNTKTSQDGKYSIAQIINDGRPEVRPKKAKYLYIPVSKKAKDRNKPYGAPIPEDFVYGKDNDYVFAKKSKAVAPTNFIDKEEEKGVDILSKALIKKVKDHFK